MVEPREWVIHLGNQYDHWCPIWKIDSKFEYKRNNKSNDDPTPLQDKNRSGPSAPRWGCKIVTAFGAYEIGGLEGGIGW